MTSSLTDWIDAITGVLTLLAAVAAGVYARAAAHWTKEQAVSAHTQTAIAREQAGLTAMQADIARDAVLVARDDMDLTRLHAQEARRDAQRTALWAAQARSDAVMPTVMISVAPGTDRYPLLQQAIRRPRESEGVWEDVEEVRDVPHGLFRIAMTIDLQNVSAHPARISIVDLDRGETDLDTDEVVLRPGASRSFEWTRPIRTADLHAEPDEVVEQAGRVRLEFWVRDLAHNAHDVIALTPDVGAVTRVGKVYRVAGPARGWSELVGTPAGERVYDRIPE